MVIGLRQPSAENRRREALYANMVLRQSKVKQNRTYRAGGFEVIIFTLIRAESSMRVNSNLS